MSDEINYFEAYEKVLTPLFTASSVLNLVARATDTGLMTAMRDPSSIDALVGASGLPAATVATMCRALVMLDIAARDANGYVLTPPWRALTAPDAFVPLDLAIEGNIIDSHLMRTGGSYFELTAEQRVAYARSVSPNPFSDQLVEWMRAEIARDPDRAGMAHGGRLLELGCGVAGRVLTTLRAMPELTAVGVELTEDLAAEAQRRVDALGLTDRCEIVCADASSYRSDVSFDFAFWSQFFFPQAAREAALATLMACVRPGGTVQSPLGPDFDKMRAEPNGPVARDFALWRVVLQSWDVPERDPEALVAEFEAAGFVDVAVTNTEGSAQRVRATRP